MRLKTTVLNLVLALSVAGARATLSDDDLLRIKFDQKPGAQVSPDLVFRDESGKNVRFGDYFGKKPVVLVTGYYGCPMLCTLVLNGAIDGFRGLKRDVGDAFDIVFISVDPSETPALAAAKKESYVRSYGRGRPGGWHFLTGDAPTIRALTDEIGYRFAYDASTRQFAHPSGLVILTPDGRVSRYLTGVTFPAKELDIALREAAGSKVAPPEEQSFLLCFHYAPVHGKYGRLVMEIVRAGGIATVLVLGIAVFSKPRRRKPERTS